MERERHEMMIAEIGNLVSKRFRVFGRERERQKQKLCVVVVANGGDVRMRIRFETDTHARRFFF